MRTIEKNQILTVVNPSSVSAMQILDQPNSLNNQFYKGPGKDLCKNQNSLYLPTEAIIDVPPPVNPCQSADFKVDSGEGLMSLEKTKVKIRKKNFFQLVEIVKLDEKQMYGDQDICLFCSKKFVYKKETRTLPCKHAFHGKCAHNEFIIKKQRVCPICKFNY